MDLQGNILNLYCPDLGKVGFSRSNREVEVFLFLFFVLLLKVLQRVVHIITIFNSQNLCQFTKSVSISGSLCFLLFWGNTKEGWSMVTDFSLIDFAIFFCYAQVCSHKHTPISEPSEHKTVAAHRQPEGAYLSWILLQSFTSKGEYELDLKAGYDVESYLHDLH